jgi:phosphatidylglycerophosphatase A
LNIFRDFYGKNQLICRQIISDPVLFLAFGFGSGLIKKAPGTMGTIAAIPVYYFSAQFSIIGYIAIILFTGIIGIWLCDQASKKLGEHDFNGIVWDEIVGYLITMSFVDFSITHLIIGFILFRLFDIIKPQPIAWIDQRVNGGLGIMLDDVIAGVFAAIILKIISTLI